jgi:cobaltochelatase CobN
VIFRARLTNLLALGHPASVDLYVERRFVMRRLSKACSGRKLLAHGAESLRSGALRRARCWLVFQVS